MPSAPVLAWAAPRAELSTAECLPSPRSRTGLSAQPQQSTAVVIANATLILSWYVPVNHVPVTGSTDRCQQLRRFAPTFAAGEEKGKAIEKAASFCSFSTE